MLWVGLMCGGVWHGRGCEVDKGVVMWGGCEVDERVLDERVGGCARVAGLLQPRDPRRMP